MKPRNETIAMNTLLAMPKDKFDKFIQAVTLLRDDQPKTERPRGASSQLPG